MNEDVVGDDEYLDEFSSDDGTNEFDENEIQEPANPHTEGENHTSRINNFFGMEETYLPVHKKNITGLNLTMHAHDLIVTGNDHLIRIYNFRKMNRHELHYTNCIKLTDGSIVSSLDVVKNSMLISSGLKCHIYGILDNKVEKIHTTIRGDMYIKDMKNTKGHTRSINYCKFHPIQNHLFMSGSQDSTVRIWDLEKNTCYGIDKELVHSQCLKVLSEKNYMNKNVLCCEFSKDGNHIIIGCDCGQVEIRNKISSDFSYSPKADILIKSNTIHTDDITSILPSKKNNFIFFSRSLDSSVKQWDLRKPNSPVRSISNVPTLLNKSNMSFYEEERYLIWGTQEIRTLRKEEEDLKVAENQTKEYIENVLDLEEHKLNAEGKKEELINNYIKVYKGDDDMNEFLNHMSKQSKDKVEKQFSGKIQIYDLENCKVVYEKSYEHSGIICTFYNQSVHQLFAGTTEGTCVINYNAYSKNGVLNYMSKSIKRKEDPKFFMNTDKVYNLDTLPKEVRIMDDGSVLIKKGSVNKKVKICPDSQSFSTYAYEKKNTRSAYSNFIIDEREEKKNKSTKEKPSNEEDEEEDIVDILRKREMNKKAPTYFMRAYEENQPVNIIDYSDVEEQEYSEFLKKPKCPRCGIKNCICGYMTNKK